MKCLVAVKRVVDPYVSVRVKSDNSGVETDNVKMAMNPFDEIAMEAAVQFKENNIISEIIAVSIGDSSSQETLRQALARGADTAILIETDKKLFSLDIAKILKKLVEQHDPTLVLLGKQAIDDDCNQTGQMLAALLNWSQGTFCSDIQFVAADNLNSVKVTREVDAGLEMLNLKLPAVITTDLRLNEPSYISLPNVMKAKSKPLTITSLDSLDLNLMDKLTILKTTAPETRKAGVNLETVAELVDKLKNEAQVI